MTTKKQKAFLSSLRPGKLYVVNMTKFKALKHPVAKRPKGMSMTLNRIPTFTGPLIDTRDPRGWGYNSELWPGDVVMFVGTELDTRARPWLAMLDMDGKRHYVSLTLHGDRLVKHLKQVTTAEAARGITTDILSHAK